VTIPLSSSSQYTVVYRSSKMLRDGASREYGDTVQIVKKRTKVTHTHTHR